MKDVVKVEGKLGVLHKQQQQQVLDPFDSFGGDVFEVAAKESGTEVKVEPEVEPESEIKAEVAMSSEVEQKQLKKIETKSETPIENDYVMSNNNVVIKGDGECPNGCRPPAYDSNNCQNEILNGKEYRRCPCHEVFISRGNCVTRNHTH